MIRPARIAAFLTLLGAIAVLTFPVYGEDHAPESWTETLRWLENNPESPQFGSILRRAVTLAPSLRDLETLAGDYLPDVQESRIRGEVFHRIGRAFETSNRFARASEWYAEAIQADPERLEALRDHSAVLLELGEYDQAITQLTRVINNAPDRELQRHAGVLRARAFLLKGEENRALTHARSLAGTTAEPETVFLLLEVARAVGDSELEEQTLDRLRRGFEETPERALSELPRLDRSRVPTVTHYPAPTRIFGGGAIEVPRQPIVERTVPVEPVKPVEPTRGEDPSRAEPDDRPPVTGIQTGSFRDRENAEYMVRDIEDLGFSAGIRPVQTESGTFYRVVIPVDEDSSVADAQEMIVRMKEQGMEGFLLFQ